VPKLTVIIGGSYGAGNYGMCGRAFGPRFLWTWPNAKISVMGGKQAAEVLTTVRKQGLEKTGRKVSEKELAAFQQEMQQKYEDEASAYYATARLWDDGIIDPAQTRDVLGLALAVVKRVPMNEGAERFGVFRM